MNLKPRHTIKKAIFPVAGMGTRFLPATKANPKEMMPVVDKPLIQYAVEEAIAAGIRELIFVTSSSKRAIEDHFDSNFELESRLEAKGQEGLLETVRNILPRGVSCVYIRQPEALGLGHAILCARPIVGDEPFAILLADDLMDNLHQAPCLESMVLEFSKTNSAIIAVESVRPEDSDKYGMVGVGDSFSGLGQIKKIVEKPKPKDAPSHLAVVGRYLLTPGIFNELAKLKPGANGEIQLTDAIAALLSKEAVFAMEFPGKRYDCGSKLGYLQAIVNYGMKHPEVGQEFKRYLETLHV